jgi:hypothetical protein
VTGTTKMPTLKNIIPAAIVAKAAELRDQQKTHVEVCAALNELGFRTPTGKKWRHPQQIVQMLKSVPVPIRQ